MSLGWFLVVVPGIKMQPQSNIFMQGYYSKQRHTSRMRLFKAIQDYIITGRGHIEIWYYSSDLVYLVDI